MLVALTLWSTAAVRCNSGNRRRSSSGAALWNSRHYSASLIQVEEMQYLHRVGCQAEKAPALGRADHCCKRLDFEIDLQGMEAMPGWKLEAKGEPLADVVTMPEAELEPSLVEVVVEASMPFRRTRRTCPKALAILPNLAQR